MLLSFPVSASATHNGVIAITRIAGNDAYDIQLFERPLYWCKPCQMAHLVVDADGNAVYFSNHFKDVVYSSYPDDTLPVGQYAELNICLLNICRSDHFDSYQHLRSILLLVQSDTSQPLLQELDSRIREAAWDFSGNAWDSYWEASNVRRVPASLFADAILRLHYKGRLWALSRWFLWVSSLRENS